MELNFSPDRHFFNRHTKRARNAGVAGSNSNWSSATSNDSSHLAGYYVHCRLASHSVVHDPLNIANRYQYYSFAYKHNKYIASYER